MLDVCITEFNEKSFVDGIKEEGRAEGITEGMTKGISKGKEEVKVEMVVSMHDNGMNIEQIAQIAKTDIAVVKKWIEDTKN